MNATSIIDNFIGDGKINKEILDNCEEFSYKDLAIFSLLLFKYTNSEKISIVIDEKNNEYNFITINKADIIQIKSLPNYIKEEVEIHCISKNEVEQNNVIIIYSESDFNYNELKKYIHFDVKNKVLVSNIFDEYYQKQFADAFKYLKTNKQITYNMSYFDEKKIQEYYKMLNQTEHDFKNKTNIIVDKINIIAKLHPHKKALTFRGEDMTFGELNKKSEILANSIHKKIGNKKIFIPICVDRSFEMYIGILAILKLGSAYVPLDPNLPKKNINYILKDINSQIILTTNKYQNLFLDYETILLNKDMDNYENIESVNIKKDRNDKLYVIYTSGTTGDPKGVLLKNKSVANRLDWMIEKYKFTHKDVFIQKTPFNFDVSVWEIFIPLMIGSRTIIVNPDGHRDTSYLKDIINKYNVSVIHFVPSMLNAFLEEEDSHLCKSIKKVFCSGEELKLKQVEKFFNIFESELHNLYGPTEAAIDVTSYKCEKNTKTVPIGKPIYNMNFLILKDGKVQPTGHRGELYVGGIGLAEGYIKKDEETRRVFINNNFKILDCDKIYKTGDIVRLNKDGDIVYLGRDDKQIKIRGNRVEIGTIESSILKINDVKDVFVKGIEKEYGNILVGFILTNKKSEFWNIEELKRQLSEDLVSYMIPNEFIFMENWELSHNGKIDKKKIIEQYKNDIEKNNLRKNKAANRNLKSIIEDVLSIREVDDSKSFHSIGGDSITALIVSSKAKKNNINITVQDILGSKKISDIKSHTVKNKHRTELHNTRKLSAIQQWFFNKDLNNINKWNMSLFLELKEDVNMKIVTRAIKKVFSEHEIFKTRFIRKNKEYIQKIYNEQNIEVFQFNMKGKTNIKMKKLIDHIQNNLDIEKKLYSVALIEGDQKNYLFLAFHHLIMDGVSWRILIDDIEEYYFSNNDNQKSLSEPFTYNNWCAFQNELVNTSILEKDIYYWNHLFELPEKNIIKKIKDSPGIMSMKQYLSSKYTEYLINKCLDKGYEINEILLAPLADVFRTLNNNNIYVSLEGHGREEIQGFSDFSRTIGWFTSIYPINIKFETKDSQLTILEKIQNHLKSIPYKGMTYGILKNLSNNIREIPKPIIKYNYLGQFKDSQLFHYTNVLDIEDVSKNEKAEYPLDITTRIIDGKLELLIEYDNNFEEDEVMNISNIYLESLKKLIDVLLNTDKDMSISNEDKEVLSKLGYTWEEKDE